MKLEAPVNPNYAAMVVRVPKLIHLPNSDNLVGIPIMGMQAIVSRGSVQEGDIGIIFPAEVQLSNEYCSLNNLFRHEYLNSEPEQTGYLEDNRRVRAIKLRGNRSDALFMPLHSLTYAFVGAGTTDDFRVGAAFDTLNGHEICRKYDKPVHVQRGNAVKKEQSSRVDARMFPEHFDTTHWFRNEEAIRERHAPDTEVIVTQKLHGTLLRVGNTIVKRRLNFVERVLRRLGVPVVETEYAMVYGSNHVIKGEEQEYNHYYGSDLWSHHGSKLNGLIPKGFIVYGELIGYTVDGAPIQKHYTYDCSQSEGEAKFYVYRVTHINEDGHAVDFSWDQIKQFCDSTGVPHVPEIARGPLRETQAEVIINLFMDVKFSEVFVPDTTARMVPLSPDSPCDEGICLRIEGLTPEIFKCKSPMFLAHETKQLDTDEPSVGDSEWSPMPDDIEVCILRPVEACEGQCGVVCPDNKEALK